MNAASLLHWALTVTTLFRSITDLRTQPTQAPWSANTGLSCSLPLIPDPHMPAFFLSLLLSLTSNLPEQVGLHSFHQGSWCCYSRDAAPAEGIRRFLSGFVLVTSLWYIKSLPTLDCVSPCCCSAGSWSSRLKTRLGSEPCMAIVICTYNTFVGWLGQVEDLGPSVSHLSVSSPQIKQHNRIPVTPSYGELTAT